MSAIAVTGFRTRTKIAWTRLKSFRRAAGEYCGLIVQAQRTLLFGTALGIGAAWLNVLPGVTVPGWAVGAIIVSTLFLVQFQAFNSVREQREECLRARAVDAVLDEVAVLRTRETQLRNRIVRDPAAYAQWKAELLELRGEIHKKLERGISRAEAETFHTIGNLRHTASGGINDEHNLLLAVVTRDLDHLAELIHGHTRFGD